MAKMPQNRSTEETGSKPDPPQQPPWSLLSPDKRHSNSRDPHNHFNKILYISYAPPNGLWTRIIADVTLSAGIGDSIPDQSSNVFVEILDYSSEDNEDRISEKRV